jgi:antitoxin CptB
MVLAALLFVSRQRGGTICNISLMRTGAWKLNDKEWQRLRWQCRRGMLELDEILQPFIELDRARLDASLMPKFALLLESSDLDLMRWLLRGDRPEEPGLAELCGLIRECHRARHQG